MFRIVTLGTCSITREDGAPVSLDAHQPKRTALIAYLAAARPRGPQRRDSVVALLWPELDEARARGALRQAVHAIRKAVGADAIRSQGLEALEVSRDVFTCDVWDLVTASDAADHARVLDLYQGDFLAGLNLSDAPAFERWLDSERARLRDLAKRSAWHLAKESARTASTDVVARVRAAIGFSENDEGALRSGMRLLAQVGDRASAIAVYEQFAAELRRELDVEVDPVTQALALEIRGAERLSISPAVAAVERDGPEERQRRGIAVAEGHPEERQRRGIAIPGHPEERQRRGIAVHPSLLDCLGRKRSLAALRMTAPANPRSLAALRMTAPAKPRSLAALRMTAPAKPRSFAALRMTSVVASVKRTSSTIAPPAIRTSHGRRVLIGAAAGMVAMIIAARYTLAADAALDPRRVDVSPFANETSDTTLDRLAREITLGARGALAQVQGAVVTVGSGSAGTRVQGTLRVDGDSVIVRSEVVDVRSGGVVRVVSTSMPDARQAHAALPRFTDRLSTAVATALYPGWGNALSEPPSFNAYRLFLSGMRDIKREQHDRAIDAFRRAFDEDSSFTAAGLLAAMELYQTRRYSAADSLASAIERRRITLRPIDEHLLDWTVRSLRGDRFGARAAMQAVVALAPEADLAWLQLAIDNVETARPREALSALDHIDRTAEFGEGWASFWATRIEALHLLGDHSRELAVARDGLARHPELRVLVNYELRALAALGRVDELDARLRSMPVGLDSTSAILESTVRQAAQELRAHGYASAAQRLLARLKDSYQRPETGGAPSPNRLSEARTYYLAGEDGKAAAIYDSVYRAHPRCLECAGLLGVIAARRGDRTAAEGHMKTLTESVGSARFAFGRPMLWRARIANALGDRALAATLLASAFANGLEFDVMTHADPDLQGLRPDSIYRAFAAAR